MALAFVEECEAKPVRDDDVLVVFGDDDVEAPGSKRQRSNDSSFCVLDVSVQPRGGSIFSHECLSAVTGSEVDGRNVESNSAVVREVEKSLIGDKQVGSSDSAVSEQNAARVLRSLEEELGLSESEDNAAVSSMPCTGEEAAHCTASFAGWGDDFWSMHGFSSADLPVGCSSGSSLTGDDFSSCERFDILPMLNQADNAPPVSMCFHLEGSNDQMECASSAGAEKARFYGAVKERVLNEKSSMTAAHGVPAVVDNLENLHNAVSWASEEGFDDYSGFSDIALGDEWMTPVDNLEFLLDSTSARASITPFVEEIVPF